MSDLIHVDVSEHQDATFDNTYTRQFGMFRAASEWDRPDAKAPANLAWCVKARAAGGLVNFGVYVIPGNVPNDAIMGRLDALGVPDDCVIMLDVESWGGLITGDHSLQFNILVGALRTRQSQRSDLVWGYLNPNVDADLWPSRPPWLGFIQPAYGKANPPDPKGLNRIGWQYCNAVQNGTTYPSATPPFGRCDHNVMYVNYPTPGDDMGWSTWTPAEQQALVDAVWAKALTYTGGLTIPAADRLTSVDHHTGVDLPAQIKALSAQVTALSKAVAALPTGGTTAFDMVGTLSPKAPS